MPPSCAITIAISASVTVSIAADSTGMLSAMPRVSRVRGSAIDGTISLSAGQSSTSSKVRPRRMSMSCQFLRRKGVVAAHVTKRAALR